MNISLTEAASLLGVTKETLRNWDKSGKLKSSRDPKSNYRTYALSDVQALVPPTLFKLKIQEEDSFIPSTRAQNKTDQDSGHNKDIKRTISRLHKILRDSDGNSSLIERFDEVTKLLFLKLSSQGDEVDIFKKNSDESTVKFVERIRLAFQRESHSKKHLFPEKFRNINLSDKALVAAAETLSELDIATINQDIKGVAYEEMIKNTFDKSDNQQFFTPKPIVEFMVSMMLKELGGVTCDPAAGTGGFLVEIIKRELNPKLVVALEVDERLAWISGINLLVHGAARFDSHCLADGGSLGGQGSKMLGTFDAIVTNPPFGSEFSGPELQDYILGKGRSSRRRGVIFIERCIDLLKEGGYLAIIIDEGVLALPSNSDVRELILNRADLLAVISLPDTAFMPYASVATSILILKKNKRPAESNLTFYARAENIGRKINGDPDIIYDNYGQETLNSDLPKILEAWNEYVKHGIKPELYEDIYLGNKKSLLSAEKSNENRIDYRFHHPARIAAQTSLQRCTTRLVSLKELCEVRNDSVVPSVDLSEQMIPYTGLAHIDPKTGHVQQVMVSGSSLKSSVRRYQRGDILFAKMRPALRKVAYIEFEKAGFASAECVVLSVKDSDKPDKIIDPYLLSILLRSDYVYGQIIHLIAGIGRPRISAKDLLQIKIPLPNMVQQREIISQFCAAKKANELLREQIKEMTKIAETSDRRAIEDLARSLVGAS